MLQSSSRFLAPLLLLLAALLTAGNYALRPERTMAWAITFAFVVAMGVVLYLMRPRTEEPGAMRRASDALSQGVVFGGTILVVSLGLSLVRALVWFPHVDLARRSEMIVLGVLLMMMGNVMPKQLSPLAQPQCSGAKIQAFQRASGWTWVLTGLAYMSVWMFAPIDVAKPWSIAVMVAGMLTIVSLLLRLRGFRRLA